MCVPGHWKIGAQGWFLEGVPKDPLRLCNSYKCTDAPVRDLRVMWVLEIERFENRRATLTKRNGALTHWMPFIVFYRITEPPCKCDPSMLSSGFCSYFPVLCKSDGREKRASFDQERNLHLDYEINRFKRFLIILKWM